MTRIETAMKRIEAARSAADAPSQNSVETTSGSPKLMELVNAHERLREEVADTIGQLDSLIEDLEG